MLGEVAYAPLAVLHPVALQQTTVEGYLAEVKKLVSRDEYAPLASLQPVALQHCLFVLVCEVTIKSEVLGEEAYAPLVVLQPVALQQVIVEGYLAEVKKLVSREE